MKIHRILINLNLVKMKAKGTTRKNLEIRNQEIFLKNITKS